MSQLQYHHEEPRASKESKINLATRVATFASLAVTIIVLQTNRANVTTVDGGEFKLTYDNYFDTYKYVFYVSIVGLFYTLLLIPFAVYYLRAKKRLIDSYILLQLEFYGDKIITLLLGAGAGAAFLATNDLKKYTLDSESGANQFFDMNFIASAFILVGSLGSAISSIFSSLALSKYE